MCVPLYVIGIIYVPIIIIYLLLFLCLGGGMGSIGIIGISFLGDWFSFCFWGGVLLDYHLCWEWGGYTL